MAAACRTIYFLAREITRNADRNIYNPVQIIYNPIQITYNARGVSGMTKNSSMTFGSHRNSAGMPPECRQISRGVSLWDPYVRILIPTLDPLPRDPRVVREMAGKPRDIPCMYVEKTIRHISLMLYLLVGQGR